MISQPAIALAFCPEGSTAATYAQNVVGLKCLKNGDGDWSCTLDRGIKEGKLVINVTVALASAVRCSVSVSLGGADSEGNVSVFGVSTLDNAGAALDTGLMISVFEIPETT